jgi:hypothetical protein
VDPAAYESYLKGRYYIYNQSFTDPVSLNQAKSILKKQLKKIRIFLLPILAWRRLTFAS